VVALILEARGLRHSYPGGVATLDGLDLAVSRGSKVALLGANGAGKTTLLMHLNGTLRPQAGEVLVDGMPARHDRAGLTAWRRTVGLVMQDPEDQLFAATVAQDVSYGPLNLGLGEAEARERVAEALSAMRIADLADRPTHMLSFGQKKRVAIAGLLAMRPAVLLLDEPTAGLDGHGEVHLLGVLRKLTEAGTTIVFATHDSDLACAWADSVALFHAGRILRHGPPAEVLADAALVRTVRLRIPFAIEVGLAARSLGLVADGVPLPQGRAEVVALLERLAARGPAPGGGSHSKHHPVGRCP
jgi:cobalt/nickel transport system ATP-binding protein